MKIEQKISSAEIKEQLANTSLNGVSLRNLLTALPLHKKNLALALDSYWSIDDVKLFTADDTGFNNILVWYNMTPGDLANSCIDSKLPTIKNDDSILYLRVVHDAYSRTGIPAKIAAFDKRDVYDYFCDNAIIWYGKNKPQSCLMNIDTEIFVADEVKNILNRVCADNLTVNEFTRLCKKLNELRLSSYNYNIYRVCTASELDIEDLENGEDNRRINIIASFLNKQKALDFIRDRFSTRVNSNEFEILLLRTYSNTGDPHLDSCLTKNEIKLITENLLPINFSFKDVRVETVMVDEYEAYKREQTELSELEE